MIFPVLLLALFLLAFASNTQTLQFSYEKLSPNEFLQLILSNTSANPQLRDLARSRYCDSKTWSDLKSRNNLILLLDSEQKAFYQRYEAFFTKAMLKNFNEKIVNLCQPNSDTVLSRVEKVFAEMYEEIRETDDILTVSAEIDVTEESLFKMVAKETSLSDEDRKAVNEYLKANGDKYNQSVKQKLASLYENVFTETEKLIRIIQYRASKSSYLDLLIATKSEGIQFLHLLDFKNAPPDILFTLSYFVHVQPEATSKLINNWRALTEDNNNQEWMRYIRDSWEKLQKYFRKELKWKSNDIANQLAKHFNEIYSELNQPRYGRPSKSIDDNADKLLTMIDIAVNFEDPIVLSVLNARKELEKVKS
jgi:hypothetical protein